MADDTDRKAASGEIKKVDPQYPAGDALSVGHEAAAGTIATAANLVLPLSGPLVQSLIKKAIKTPTDVRREIWFETLGKGVRELQDRFDGFDPKRLSESEEFMDVVAEATRIALKTARDEKHEALKNAVINTAIDKDLEEVVRGKFIHLLDTYSGLHFLVLRFLGRDQIPKGGNEYHLGISQAANEVICHDLLNEKLIGAKDIPLTNPWMSSKSTTPLGDMLIKFITNPTKSPDEQKDILREEIMKRKYPNEEKG